jgi:hypothetical protein
LSCLAALLFVAVLGWHAADHVGTSPSPVSSVSLTATIGGSADSILPGAAHLGDSSAVADQLVVKQVELERLVAVAAAAAAGLLLLVGRPRRRAAERSLRGRVDRSGWRSRAPPPAFVS